MTTAIAFPSLQRLDPNTPHTFIRPVKKINDHQDVQTFLSSLAYRDIMIFILQLNRCMLPSKTLDEEGNTAEVEVWTLDSDSIDFSEPVRRLQLLLSKLESLIDEVAPDTGPRRFGNISFRKWCEEMESRTATIMDECLPPEILQQKSEDGETVTAKEELMAYLTGSFGSSQRLDYGTGHELSFLAFLACLWKLNGFARADPGEEERGIVVGVIEPYLRLVRRLILTYTLEPAGSHGVWGLDDHSFISYVLGSAQLSPAIAPTEPTPTEGSLPNAPATADVAKLNIVEKERKSNMYFSAIGFIHDVKKGPFWEHSPMLYDISGIKDGWGKINKVMIALPAHRLELMCPRNRLRLPTQMRGHELPGPPNLVVLGWGIRVEVVSRLRLPLRHLWLTKFQAQEPHGPSKIPNHETRHLGSHFRLRLMHQTVNSRLKYCEALSVKPGIGWMFRDQDAQN
ncbi:uncharacterized protein GIQ15_00875 [Arthroderma uncinatum]|uniref:uncharacterized protein n=1 Tax=Arthroderma uncinatum TaxID=74035 RepID=UPI00144A6BCE|nr:uncharacterized protein GIQ15_00875 [Arthroderma uncinatum]KAF3491358.1 hypothetical protein GIQ15_00875 [Arthroderma uncinatum]